MGTPINPVITKAEIVSTWMQGERYYYLVVHMSCDGFESYICKTQLTPNIIDDPKIIEELKSASLLLYRAALQDRYASTSKNGVVL